MKFIFTIIGAYIGAIVDSFSGFFFGAFIGFLLGFCFDLKKQIKSLQEKQALIYSKLIESDVVVDETTTDGIHVDNIDIEEIALTEEVIDSEEDTQINPASYTAQKGQETNEPEPVDWDDNRDIPANDNGLINNIVTFVTRFFTQGNVVVKVGVIILFFGVAFLFKFAAQHNIFPIELRLLIVAAGAVLMLIFGWRLRATASNYALVLQGGAVGLLYLTVFSAAKFYSVLPLSMTFFLMLLLVVFSCFLALLQDSRSLALFATIGGFLAPILTSTGTGSHIALFTYYLILNAGIFGIAWFKAWRILNWLGFVFTFVVASLWGHDSYQADYFYTTEPFLLLFFIFYVGISILFVYKQPPNLKGLVDGSLVFGVPLVGFTLQSLLVKDYEYGQAISALALGIFYIILARVMWNRAQQGMRLLAESFLALGVVFSTLAIPFAFEGHWTATAWALEGAGIAWIGVHQNRLAPRLFGILIQVAGGFIFLLSNLPLPNDAIPILNSLYMGSLIVTTGGLFTAYIFYKYKSRLKSGEQSFPRLLLVWGLCWWFGSGLIEIDEFVEGRYEINIALIFISFSALVISLIARTLNWKTAESPPILLLPVMYFITLILILDPPSKNILLDYGLLAWVSAFTIQALLLYRCNEFWHNKLLSVWHAFTMYLYIFICCWAIADFVDYLLPNQRVWSDVIWGLLPALGILKMSYLRDRISWPISAYPQSYVGKGLFPIVVYVGLWILLACKYSGDPQPLPYVPVFNPLELVQLSGILIILNWLYLVKTEAITDFKLIDIRTAFSILGIIGFIWITSVVAHSVHFYAGVRFNETAMLRSDIFQTSISIVWTLSAFVIMWLATRNQWRFIWFAGACLLGVVVVKLFLIDLADKGTVTRIISFMTVGILMLVIGYLSPIPPKEKQV